MAVTPKLSLAPTFGIARKILELGSKFSNSLIFTPAATLTKVLELILNSIISSQSVFRSCGFTHRKMMSLFSIHSSREHEL